MPKISAQSDVQTWQLQLDQPIARIVGSDLNIRLNTGSKFNNPIQLGRVWFGP